GANSVWSKTVPPIFNPCTNEPAALLDATLPFPSLAARETIWEAVMNPPSTLMLFTVELLSAWALVCVTLPEVVTTTKPADEPRTPPALPVLAPAAWLVNAPPPGASVTGATGAIDAVAAAPATVAVTPAPAPTAPPPTEFCGADEETSFSLAKR